MLTQMKSSSDENLSGAYFHHQIEVALLKSKAAANKYSCLSVCQFRAAASALIASSAVIDHHAPPGSCVAARSASTTTLTPTSVANKVVFQAHSGANLGIPMGPSLIRPDSSDAGRDREAHIAQATPASA